MVRNRQRKTTIGLHEADKIKEAIEQIKQGKKIGQVAKLMNIPYTTLYRYHSKSVIVDNPRYTPNYANRQIFDENQEKSLVEYIVKCSQMFYGLTPVEVRRLGYEMANTNNIRMPDKWHESKLAGIDWFYHFRKRHQTLSLRVPEGCSLSRATAFNRHNVGIFFDNLENVMRREPTFGDGTRIFNLDETNTMTVQTSGKVLAIRGQKQVSKVTSAEKGTLVTTCCIINALGQALPPVMIYPRVHFKDHMTVGAPNGTLGLANPSGWMNGALFIETMKHFIKFSQSSKENKSLLIMDNYEAHICLEAINLARQNGVTILTVPPHSTGKLQPLDVAVFKPFKVAYNAAVDSWLMRNPGKTFSIYQVAECVGEAHMRSMTPANICSAFKCTGIYPFNRNIFTELDFAPSQVTNREQPDGNDRTDNPATFLSGQLQENLVENQQQCTSESPNLQHSYDLEATQIQPSQSCGCPSTSKVFTSPFEFRGLPKAGDRKSSRAPRRKGKSMVATDTPNKLEIEKRSEEKKRKQNKEATQKKRKILQSESSEEENDQISVYSEEEAGYEDEDDDEQNEIIVTEPFVRLEEQPKEGDFILVQFIICNKKIFYLAKVIRGGNRVDVEVSFLRKSSKIINSFQLPNVPDIATVPLEDIKMILTKPSFSGGTKRQQGMYKFNIDFSKLDLR